MDRIEKTLKEIPKMKAILENAEKLLTHYKSTVEKLPDGEKEKLKEEFDAFEWTDWDTL